MVQRADRHGNRFSNERYVFSNGLDDSTEKKVRRLLIVTLIIKSATVLFAFRSYNLYIWAIAVNFATVNLGLLIYTIFVEKKVLKSFITLIMCLDMITGIFLFPVFFTTEKLRYYPIAIASFYNSFNHRVLSSTMLLIFINLFLGVSTIVAMYAEYLDKQNLELNIIYISFLIMINFDYFYLRKFV